MSTTIHYNFTGRRKCTYTATVNDFLNGATMKTDTGATNKKYGFQGFSLIKPCFSVGDAG